MLGLEKKVSQIFSEKEILPSVGQGVIALQTRIKDIDTMNLIKEVNDLNTFIILFFFIRVASLCY